MQPRRLTPFHRALHRPQQIMGGERELMLFSMLIAVGLIVSAMNFVATIIGLIIWFVCVQGLRKMAKADPEMSKVYIRQLKYKHYYGPFSRPFRMAKSPRIH
ncbi:conjugal transfer protein TrbD [Verminephrobacter aporrectodeae subsp. tuberculatae]|nr:conjugal transfer protein TrbD [Verminephrobacter aporrectodeae subsp. tuberculatae]MCW5255658.1 conjugal transfer protein TrbD [Verminephrobacter aporrectodeae subsp. tuberculatae]MCW5289673.1 conjugal transfer protein TrbD [Verminephrobacter aporrectodeae subsp. tuberculatae]MCW8164815.1 conjugal transfer protein TrbD [Verminephrobacter aporrectodeae subsp. tuberculatae]MCW8169187.1 conjugal transfer protein TrbD [Verminephrobacter aporrectodeae subsp. tuberculatae]